jgi:hypothetical protein
LHGDFRFATRRVCAHACQAHFEVGASRRIGKALRSRGAADVVVPAVQVGEVQRAARRHHGDGRQKAHALLADRDLAGRRRRARTGRVQHHHGIRDGAAFLVKYLYLHISGKSGRSACC